MPYIDLQARRELFVDPQGRFPENVGELTYAIQQVLQTYLEIQGLRYQQIAEIDGALSQAKRDFNERVVVPYEKKAIERNGDVWPKTLTT